MLESEIFSVFVGEAFDGDHASSLDSRVLFGFEGLAHGVLVLFVVGFVLETFMAVNSDDLAKS